MTKFEDMTKQGRDDAHLRQLAAVAGRVLAAAGWRLATAESCTGGWVAKCLTDVPGSSGWFERGYVTYSNQAKEQSIGVSPELIATLGAVSREVAEQMAAGALHASGAEVALAITGVAGPDGGTDDKPVGLVWLAVAGRGFEPRSERCQFEGDREAIRRAAVAKALTMVAGAVEAAVPRVGGHPCRWRRRRCHCQGCVRSDCFWRCGRTSRCAPKCRSVGRGRCRCRPWPAPGACSIRGICI